MVLVIVLVLVLMLMLFGTLFGSDDGGGAAGISDGGSISRVGPIDVGTGIRLLVLSLLFLMLLCSWLHLLVLIKQRN